MPTNIRKSDLRTLQRELSDALAAVDPKHARHRSADDVREVLQEHRLYLYLESTTGETR